MPSESDLLEVHQPINPDATSVDVTCPHCHTTEEFHASTWRQQDPQGHFSLAPIRAYGVTCAGCRTDFRFKLTAAVNPWPAGRTLDVACPACQHTVTTQIAVVRQMDGPSRPDTCDACGNDFEVYADGRVIVIEYERSKGRRNLLLEAMKAGGQVIFDPRGAETAPFITDVEVLLGGVPVVIHADGTEQFLDDSAEPVHAYSPRLAADGLEAFCKANIAKYEAFSAEHGNDKLMTERVPITPFW